MLDKAHRFCNVKCCYTTYFPCDLQHNGDKSNMVHVQVVELLSAMYLTLQLGKQVFVDKDVYSVSDTGDSEKIRVLPTGVEPMTFFRQDSNL